MQRLIAAALISMIAVLGVAGSAGAEDNIYSADLKSGERHVADAQDRLAAATSDWSQANAQIPGLRARWDRLGHIADVRRAAAIQARDHADRERKRVDSLRTAAAADVATARLRQSRAVGAWRRERARSLAVAGLLMAVAGSLALAVITGRIRRPWTAAVDEQRAGRHPADRASFVLGLAVAVYLAALVTALSAFEAMVFSWWSVAAAAASVALPGGFIVGWRSSSGGSTVKPAVSRIVIAAASVAAVAAVAPVATAASDGRPTTLHIAPRTLARAADAARHAPMPRHVQRLFDEAKRKDGIASRVEGRANAVHTDLSDAQDRLGAATEGQAAAQRSIDHWTVATKRVRVDYDDYQRLIDATSADAGVDDEGLSSESDPSTDDPYGANDDPYGDSTSHVPDNGSAPTTQDFGSGSGSVGVCADGTLSDSVGRQGACSHHGGVG
jgi:hypothetical protein